MKKSASAFTLIELLVVICIIAILAGIALPVFGRVTEKAHATNDLNNLRSMGVGTIAFLADNEESFFKSSDDWATILHGKYIPDWKAFKSPFDKNVNAARKDPVSYGLNENLAPASGSGGSGNTFTGNMSQLVSASQLIMYTPYYQGLPTVLASWPNKAGTAPAATKPGGTGFTKGTHANGKQINVCYADSHVGSILFKDFQETTDKTASNGVDGVKQWKPLGE